jgi:radical SAM protein with 4Fe4S-binding SPASM domain
VKKAFNRLYQKLVADVHDLHYLFIELTHKCNLKCIHCGSDCVSQPHVPDLPASDILKVLRDIKKNYNSHTIMVALTGGEALCYPDLFELGKSIYDLEFPWGMVTNGFGWTADTVRRAYRSGMQTFTISLDGMEEDHNWLRGHRESFNRAVNSIRMFMDNPGFKKMDVVTCVNKRNLHSLDDMYDLLKKLGIGNWRFFIVSPIGRASGQPDLFLDREEFRTLLNKIEEFRNRQDIKCNLSESGYIGHDNDRRVRNVPYFCLAGIHVAGIMVNGDILACPNIDRRFRQGNIRNDSFTEVWESGFKEFRDRSWMKTGDCEKCPEWKNCKGNSFHLWDIDAGKSKLCHYNRFIKN